MYLYRNSQIFGGIAAIIIFLLADSILAQPDRPRRGIGSGRSSSVRLNPDQLEMIDGTGVVKSKNVFDELSYRGPEVLIDTHLAGIQFVKFQIERINDKKNSPQLYFINTKTHRAHMMFMRAVGIKFTGFGGMSDKGRFGSGRSDDNNQSTSQMRGVLCYRPRVKAPNGESGLYTFEYEPNDNYSYEMIKFSYDMLLEKMPLLKGKLGYYPMPRSRALYAKEKGLYAKGKLPVYLDDDLFGNIGFLPLNAGKSFGTLRVMNLEQRPSPRDIVIYSSLPNQMPRVSGIITSVRQTPLSHVNLRAIQDRIPNAYISRASELNEVTRLVGKLVCYEVGDFGYRLRRASADEVHQHFESVRPKSTQTPARDLAVKEIRSLDRIKFTDSPSVGVKAANLATLKTFGMSETIVPDGYAIPFYFYDSFMKFNGFYGYAKQLMKNSKFRASQKTQIAELKKFRKLIKKGRMPEWMIHQLTLLQKSFPEGTNIRCRSSTNNEDLPGFSGAGLYDSFTHKKDEGHLAKSVMQVFASLWNFRAFDEREFYRIDHFSAAMGIVCHANFKDEIANGVAVTIDPLYETDGNYYLNTQVGEDLVTNPEEQSQPEEMLLDWWEEEKIKVVQHSNRVKPGTLILKPAQIAKMRKNLGRVHAKFAKLYGKSLESEDFAMEVEFKITKKGELVIKQARPWVQ